MLDFRQTLRFPSISLIREKTSFFQQDEEGASCATYDRGLYKIDWEPLEKYKRDRHVGRTREFYPELEIPYVDTLPEPYNTIVKNFRFSISNEYLKEIQLHTEKGFTDWGHVRHFDTSVRETCLFPAMAHIWTAFYLLSDCIWDTQKGSWWRNELKYLAPYMMAYKFWCHQTGDGCIETNAMIPRLKENLRGLEKSASSEYHIIYLAVGKAFLDALQKHWEELSFVSHIPARETSVGYAIGRDRVPTAKERQEWLLDRIQEWNGFVTMGILPKEQWIASAKNQTVFPTHIGYDNVCEEIPTDCEED